MIRIVNIASVPAEDVERLLDQAFGTDRHGRTAYRLRENSAAIAELSFAALEANELAGTIQCWPVQLTGPGDSVTPLILVGPVAVRPDLQGRGIGRRLMEAALARADADGREPMMLIGDAGYYERFFGFSPGHGQSWSVPGPVDRARLLTRLRAGQSVPANATLGPRRTETLVADED